MVLKKLIIDTKSQLNAMTKDDVVVKGTEAAPEVVLSGIVGAALGFSGGTDYVNIPDSNFLDLTNVGTIMAWIKPASIGSNMTPLSKGRVDVLDDAFGFFVGTDGIPKLYYAKTTEAIAVAGSVMTAGEKYCIVGTWDGTNLKFYQNSNLKNTAPQTFNQVATNNPLTIGTSENGAYPFSGIIDEVRTYNRALIQEEITAHYNEGLGQHGDPSENGLAAGWHFDEGTGIIASDYSGNGNAGALINMTEANWVSGLTISEYATPGTLTSNPEKIDAITLGMLRWVEELPAGTDITFATRTGPTEIPDGSWSAWSGELSNPVGSQMTSPADIYIQFRATLTTTDTSKTPRLYRG